MKINNNKIILLLIILFTVNFVFSQTININPNKSGDDWLVGGLRIPSNEEIKKIPEKKYQNIEKSLTLPDRLDNSELKYFSGIIKQTNGSCAQASGVSYTFTYEINRLRNIAGDTSVNRYPSHYTYNFLNFGNEERGSWFTDGWDIIKANGCPTVQTYEGYSPYGAKFWMSGYDKYSSSIENTIIDYFSIDVSTYEGLETMKHFFYNRFEDEQSGGLLNFAAGVLDEFTLKNDSLITEWGHQVNHALTFTGWDDSIKYDFNGDGKFTTDVDINNDGIIDLKDSETGAIIVVNTWGTEFGRNGKTYMMYKLLAEKPENGGIHANKVFGINARKEYAPELMMKVKLEHQSREKISISAGVSETDKNKPENIMNFPLFNFQGGDYPMRGNEKEPIEISLDITPLLSFIEPNKNYKFYFLVTEKDTGSLANGTIYAYSVLDYTEKKEYSTKSDSLEIKNNDTTFLSVEAKINFDTPQIITEKLNIHTGNSFFEQQIEAVGGLQPYKWNLLFDYKQKISENDYQKVSENKLETTDNDDGYAIQELEFDFPFFGEKYSKSVLNTDGSIIFVEEFDYLRTISALKSNKMLAVFASDLMIYPNQEDGIYYEGNKNQATFRWKTSLFENPDAVVDVSATLYPSGKIIFNYGNINVPDISWISGISNGDTQNYTISKISNSASAKNKEVQFEENTFPLGLSLDQNGILSGIPEKTGHKYELKISITDFNNINKTKTLDFESYPENIADNNNVIAYPNPFYDKINISFICKKKQLVKLSIYNIFGQEIIKFSEENYPEGINTITYKISESKLNFGIYFYKLTIDQKEFTDKILYMK